MHFVIMGCGRVGSTLAVNLENRGHSVSIIDSNADAFRRLPEDFTGQLVTGLGFDRDALRQAGIEDAQGFAATSSGDNSNIIAARVVRDTFGVQNVVARIYDPERAEVFNRLGIDTVTPVTWSADQMLRELIAHGPHVDYTDSQYGVTLIWVDIDESWYGMDVANIQRITESRVAYIGRYGQALLPQPDTVLQDGDDLWLLVQQQRTHTVQRIMNHHVQEDF
ncbi:trk system potassium uptake protein TrkA [Arcanobacterium phocae]|uniref:Trk system potassium uptake protein TrkA n=2 Tax=Arcanobacterium phocae TaxID=131112 RepID=A0A1H2LJT4_9ACTO|nr:trk system potassium uptake protein TrkA [Arcanobacterium phocae]